MKVIGAAGFRISALHFTIIAMSLAMTIGAWLYSKHQLNIQIENRFTASKERTIGLIIDRMSRYEDALWSGVANIAALEGELSHQEWRTFAHSLNLEEKYPGVNGIGVIYQVARAERAAFMAERAREERRNFKIFPAHDEDVLLPITFVEPEALNAAAVGLDVAHEINRRTGLLASRDSGKAQITEPIILVQDSGNTPGFLFYTPFYEGGQPDTVEERQARFAGVVYAPFIMRKLVAGLLAKDLREIHFSIHDGGTLLYDEHSQTYEPEYDPNPMFREMVELNIYGRTWTVDIRTTKAFRTQNLSTQPTIILIAGLVIELLVIALIAMMARANSRAQAYANEITEELRAKTDSLEQANEEIEQFVYIASHDLKTPTRGIGFLTDVLEEDLEDVIGPLETHSEIKEHLQLIRERLERMENLTSGIMEFSRINYVSADLTASLQISRMVDDCIADFKLRPDQIQLESAVETLSCDSTRFRRVMENLIGNAFKYHPDREAAKVDIDIEDEGDRLFVSISDNGPGIAPEHQQKIFDVFQTLRKGTDPDSTGIGLAIVKKAVKRHGYDIYLDSTLGSGATFSFHWPKTEFASSLEEVA
ncbi:CHASE domain-containing protein [Pseudophaeobacter flagellatus]|uniref:CHASE domain-containing protein n=1 Tax=Pseudophaeobacter flagellatus TaxID=2899119 RepID=UPI001E2E45C9|nr:CHASE domain-containing protein [Pseudophaeobacter flagellatus]MCD9149964.1 CHASE domain-containing protein [Pseudophaeobacter flagellatus]